MNRIKTASAFGRAILVATLLTTNINCGSDDSPTAPTASQTPSPGAIPTGSLVAPAASGGVPGFHRSVVEMSRSGIATFSLEWPNGDFSLQLYVTRGPCADLTALLGGACTTIGKTRPGDRPGVVEGPVSSGDLNTIWVLNSDPAPQPFTVVTVID